MPREFPWDVRYQRFIRTQGQACIAIIELGTRAVRATVLPKVVPKDWSAQKIYETDALTTNVGLDVGADKILPLRSASLVKMVEFIATRAAFLRSRGVNEFSVIGTSWLRRVLNQNAIIDYIAEATGFSVEIIDQAREAELTIAALPEILSRTNAVDGLQDGDRVFFIDQGGGSLEVSCMMWERANSRPAIAHKLFEELGTVKLRRDFFGFDRYGREVRPEQNKTRIPAQIERIQDNARSELDKWNERSNFLRGSGVKRAFAVGSAITNILGKRSRRSINNLSVPIDQIERALAKVSGLYEGRQTQVLSIYKKTAGIEGKGTDSIKRTLDEIDIDLVLLYGLPVYIELMRALEMREIRVLGYPLRYAYYVWKYFWNEPISTVRSDASKPYLFVSYARSDRNVVYDQLATLDALGIRLWWDEGRGGLVGGKDYELQLETRIRGSAGILWCLTQDSANSIEVQKELGVAERHHRKILPIELRKTGPLPTPLAQKFGKLDRLQHFRMDPEMFAHKLRASIPKACVKMQ